MRPSKTRYQLWQVMLAIAVLAGLFAAFGVIGAVQLVVVIGVPFLPIYLAPPGRRLRTLVWVSSIYPLLILSSFYATWLTAWCVLGHPPRPYTDDPDRLGSIVRMVRGVPFLLLTVGTPLIGFIGAPLIIAGVYWNMAQRRTSPWNGALQILAPPCAWLSAYAILQWDPGRVLVWFMD